MKVKIQRDKMGIFKWYLLDSYLDDDDRRLFEIDESFFIKRVYTQNGIVFECVKEPSMFIVENKIAVREWLDEQLTIKGNEANE